MNGMRNDQLSLLLLQSIKYNEGIDFTIIRRAILCIINTPEKINETINILEQKDFIEEILQFKSYRLTEFGQSWLISNPISQGTQLLIDNMTNLFNFSATGIGMISTALVFPIPFIIMFLNLWTLQFPEFIFSAFCAFFLFLAFFYFQKKYFQIKDIIAIIKAEYKKDELS